MQIDKLGTKFSENNVYVRKHILTLNGLEIGILRYISTTSSWDQLFAFRYMNDPLLNGAYKWHMNDVPYKAKRRVPLGDLSICSCNDANLTWHSSFGAFNFVLEICSLSYLI